MHGRDVTGITHKLTKRQLMTIGWLQQSVRAGPVHIDLLCGKHLAITEFTEEVVTCLMCLGEV